MKSSSFAAKNYWFGMRELLVAGTPMLLLLMSAAFCFELAESSPFVRSLPLLQFDADSKEEGARNFKHVMQQRGDPLSSSVNNRLSTGKIFTWLPNMLLKAAASSPITVRMPTERTTFRNHFFGSKDLGTADRMAMAAQQAQLSNYDSSPKAEFSNETEDVSGKQSSSKEIHQKSINRAPEITDAVDINAVQDLRIIKEASGKDSADKISSADGQNKGAGHSIMPRLRFG